VQRARILTATVDIACERGGAGDVSVAHIVQRSGVSRRTFYDVFGDREECFLGAFEQSLSLARQRVLSGFEPDAVWVERIRGGLVALLWFLDEQPRLGRILIVECTAGVPRVYERRAQVIEQLTRVLEQGAGQNGPPVGGLVGEGIVGAVLRILSSRLGDPQREPLTGLTNELMSMIVLPFLGTAAARRELARPLPPVFLPPEAEREHQPLPVDPFKDAGMRLTYRTVRVLMAIAEHPGGSNRQIGQTAEITDQGQISKLLGRMQRLGMIANTGAGARQGAPNEWALTGTGNSLVNSIRAHTETPPGKPTTVKPPMAKRDAQ
jgi:AcrR family transcriptional regulator